MRGKLILLIVSTALGFVVAEIGLRGVVDVDADGQAWLRGRPVAPLRFPWSHFERVVRAVEDEGRARLRFDAELGWTVPPGFTSEDGLYAYEASGARRTSGERDEALRSVWFFGDSFVHGDEVRGDSTFVALVDAGRATWDAENFGVSGYGDDQALLRYLSLEREREPEIVVLGHQLEDAIRNLNCVRPLYQPRTGLPFSKPRFVLDAGKLRDSGFRPLPPIGLRPGIAAFLRGESGWPERAASPEDFAEGAPRSLVLALLRSVGAPSAQARAERQLADVDSEAQRLTLVLFERFRREARARGSRPVVLLLPTVHDLRRALEGRPARAPGFVERAAQVVELLDPTSEMLEHARVHGLASLFVVAHYSPVAHRIIAEHLVGHLPLD